MLRVDRCVSCAAVSKFGRQAQRKIDVGNFYASKDNEYPTKAGGTRRINWGWATVIWTWA